MLHLACIYSIASSFASCMVDINQRLGVVLVFFLCCCILDIGQSYSVIVESFKIIEKVRVVTTAQNQRDVPSEVPLLVPETAGEIILNMENTWTVVKFTQEDSVEAVPTSWIFGNRCYWPPFTQQKMLTAIKNFESPSSCWPSHEITIFKNGTFDNYLEARKKSRIAEIQSELSEEDNLKNRKIRNKKVLSSTSNSEEELIPDPPLPKKKSVPLRMNEKPNNEKANPVPSFNSTSSTSDDSTLRQLVVNFEKFEKESMRKQNLLITMLADILSEMKTLKDSLKTLDISKRPESTSSPDTLYDKLALPAKNIEEIKDIENYLSIPENFPKVVEEMSKVGGNSPFDFIKRVLLQLMLYKVAACYTWHGTKEKLPFKKTIMCQMIMRASTAIGTKKQVEEALQKFFRRAKERSASENKATTT